MSNQSLAARLRSARERKGWTQRQLASAAGVSQGAINGLETGRRTRPTAGLLGRLAKALAVRIEALL